MGGGNAGQGAREQVNRDVRQEQQGESDQQRVHDAYHALGEVRAGEMKSGRFFSSPESEAKAKDETGRGPEQARVHDAYLELGERAAEKNTGSDRS